MLDEQTQAQSDKSQAIVTSILSLRTSDKPAWTTTKVMPTNDYGNGTTIPTSLNLGADTPIIGNNHWKNKNKKILYPQVLEKVLSPLK